MNDAHGHQAGDVFLINIAQILQKNIRETDTLGRWGGEEFMIICPDTDSHGVAALADKLRVAIAQYEFPNVQTKTASFGVTQYFPEDSAADLIKRADAALYRAKDGGKNKVEIGSR